MSFLKNLLQPEGKNRESEQAKDAADDRLVIATSLLFDADWYRRTYGLGEYLDAADHYLQQGWRDGKDPSASFSTKGYLDQNPDVAAAGVNPLLHFEKHGYTDGPLA